MHFEQTAGSDTVSTYQVCSVQLVAKVFLVQLVPVTYPIPVTNSSWSLITAIRSLQCSWSLTALKRPDRSKQCHSLQLLKVQRWPLVLF